MKFTFEPKGLKALEKRLKDMYSLNEVKMIVRKNGRQLNARMQKEAEFKGHYEHVSGKGKVFKIPTGRTKGSIDTVYTDDGFTVEVGPTTEYASYVEYGTRFMDAQPFVRPAYNEQKNQFIKDMQKLVK